MDSSEPTYRGEEHAGVWTVVLELKPPGPTACAVCGASVEQVGEFLRVFDRSLGSYPLLKDYWDYASLEAAIRRGVDLRWTLLTSSRIVCLSCAYGHLPKTLALAGRAYGYKIATDRGERAADPKELCTQCMEHPDVLMWGSYNVQGRVEEWFWFCKTCFYMWLDKPEKLPLHRHFEEVIEEEQREREKAELMKLRASRNECELCGKRLSLLDRMRRRSKHRRCFQFRYGSRGTTD